MHIPTCASTYAWKKIRSDFFRNRIDVRLCYGEHLYPEFVTIPFKRDRVTAMCQPSLLERERVDPAAPHTLRDDALIHVAWRAGFSSYPAWSAWFASQGIAWHPRREFGHTTDTSSVAIDLACSGTGIVLGQEMLAETELAAANLVTPFPHWMPLQYDYCIVHAEPNSGTGSSAPLSSGWSLALHAASVGG